MPAWNGQLPRQQFPAPLPFIFVDTAIVPPRQSRGPGRRYASLLAPLPIVGGASAPPCVPVGLEPPVRSHVVEPVENCGSPVTTDMRAPRAMPAKGRRHTSRKKARQKICATPRRQPPAASEVRPDIDAIYAMLDDVIERTWQPGMRMPESAWQDDDSFSSTPPFATPETEEEEQGPTTQLVSPLSRLSLGTIPDQWLLYWINSQRTQRTPPRPKFLHPPAEPPTEAEAVGCANVSTMAPATRITRHIEVVSLLVRDRGFRLPVPEVHGGPLPSTVVIGGRIGIVGQIVAAPVVVQQTAPSGNGEPLVAVPMAELLALAQHSPAGDRLLARDGRRYAVVRVRLTHRLLAIAAGCSEAMLAPLKRVKTDVCPRQAALRQAIPLYSGLPP